MAKGKPYRNDRVSINYETLAALCQNLSTTKEFAAEYLGVSTKTLDRRLREDMDMSFPEYKETKIQRISQKLQDKAIQMAIAGDRTMLIFSLKNYAKWQDKVDVDVTHNVGNFAEWAQKNAEAYEKRKKMRQIERTENRRARMKDVN